MRFGEHRCTTGSKLVRQGDNPGWSLRRPPAGHTSGSHRASQDLWRQPPEPPYSADTLGTEVSYLSDAKIKLPRFL